jgi:hypothetical protein
MTQSKKSDFEPTIDMSELELENIMEDDTITIDLNNTYGTTTTYWAGDSVTDVVYSGSNAGAFTIDINDLTTDTIDMDWLKDTRITLEPTMFEDCMPDPQKLKKMCEQYPALEKVYENFKTVYSMVEQDWKGNHDDEDELPF